MSFGLKPLFLNPLKELIPEVIMFPGIQASVIWLKVHTEPYHGIQEKIYGDRAISRFGSLLGCDNWDWGVCISRK